MSPAIVIALVAAPVVVAITFHEAAHGFVARHFGDDTAARSGRLTLNPLRHIDLFGTILLPAILVILNTGFVFGYAKPVPVNPSALFNPKRDMVWVAAAGPAMNLFLALLSFLLIFPVVLMDHTISRWLVPALLISIRINLVLVVLNMIPLPPLDGGKVAIGLLPISMAAPLAKVGRFGFLILIAVLVVLPAIGKKMGVNLDLFGSLVNRPLDYVTNFARFVAVHG